MLRHGNSIPSDEEYGTTQERGIGTYPNGARDALAFPCMIFFFLNDLQRLATVADTPWFFFLVVSFGSMHDCIVFLRHLLLFPVWVLFLFVLKAWHVQCTVHPEGKTKVW